MAEQVPSVGRIVHYVYGGVHVPAIITDPAFEVRNPDLGPHEPTVQQALTVFLPNAAPFVTVAAYGEEVAPGTWNNATWHWPEFVPPKSDERRDYGTSDHPMTKAEADAEPGVSGETGASA